MKQIQLGCIIIPNDDSVTLESIKEALSKLGSARFLACSEVDIADPDEVEDLTSEVVIYVPADDEDPYYLVPSAGEREGTEISVNDINHYRNVGICTAIHVEYPRASRHGVPMLATDVSFAMGEAAEHLFRTPPEEHFTVTAEDRGDDGGQELWLLISLPEDSDFGRSADELEARYGAEHPSFTREDWQQDVAKGDTRLGYWAWVMHNVESKYHDGCDECGTDECNKVYVADRGYLCKDCAAT